jgi:hypothetical protein
MWMDAFTSQSKNIGIKCLLSKGVCIFPRFSDRMRKIKYRCTWPPGFRAARRIAVLTLGRANNRDSTSIYIGNLQHFDPQAQCRTAHRSCLQLNVQPTPWPPDWDARIRT